MDIEAIASSNAANRAVDVTADTARPRSKTRPTADPVSQPQDADASLTGAPTRSEIQESQRGAQEPGETSRSEPGRGEPEAARDENPLLQNLFRSSRLKLDFRMDEETQRVVITVIDPETQETIRQVPPEEILRLAERLDSVRGGFVQSRV